jgi:outer membrane protein assembly complex protein YaeT
MRRTSIALAALALFFAAKQAFGETATSTASRLESAGIAEALATSTAAVPRIPGSFEPWSKKVSGSLCEGPLTLILIDTEWSELDRFCADLAGYVSIGAPPFDDSVPARTERLLFETGYFHAVRCERDPDGSRIWCGLVPEKIIVRTDVEGTMPFTLLKEDLSRRFYLRPGQILADPESAIPRQEQRLREQLDREGFFESQVRVRAEPSEGAEPNVGVELIAEIDAGRDTVLREIEVVGDPVLDEGDLSLLRHYWLWRFIAMRFRPIALEDDVELVTQRLKARGWPEASIEARFRTDLDEGVSDVILEVRAGPRLELIFEGNRAIDDDDLAELATFAEASAIDQVEIERTEKAIRRAYQEEGYFSPEVKSRSESAEGNVVRVFYQIIEGPKAAVDHLRFVGNSTISTATIEDEVSFETRPSALFVSGAWVDARAETDARAIEELYRRNGYAAAKVKGEPRPLGDGKLEALFAIEEGPRRTVTSLALEGLPKEVDRDRLLSKLALKGGAPYVESELGTDRRKILAALAATGFTRAEVSRKLKVPHQALAGEVSIAYRIEPGPRSTFAGVLLRGNFRTSSGVIEDQLSLEAGDPLDLAAVGEAKRRLRALGVFGSIDLRPLGTWRDEEETWLLASLEERDRRTLDAVFSFSTTDFFSVGFDYGDRNFFGRAITLNLKLRFANASELVSKDLFIGERDDIEAKARAPRPFGLPFDAEGRGFYSFENRPAYRERRVGTSFALSKALLARTACEICPTVIASLGYELTATELDLTRTTTAAISMPIDPAATIGRVVPKLIFDRRDSFVDPRSGWAAELRYEIANRYLAGPFYSSASDFWRFVVSLQTFIRLGAIFERRLDDGGAIGGPFVIALGLRYGVAHPYGTSSAVPAAETFFYGGDLSVRGLSQGASRAGLAAASYLLVENLELRLYVLQDFGFGSIQIAGFLDAGAVSLHLGELLDDPTLSVGPVLRWVTPIGPLTLSYGWPIVRSRAIETADPSKIPASGTLHFAFGYSF